MPSAHAKLSPSSSDTPTPGLTPDEIDDLPPGTIIKDRDGDRIMRYPNGWRYLPPADWQGGTEPWVAPTCKPSRYPPYELTGESSNA